MLKIFSLLAIVLFCTVPHCALAQEEAAEEKQPRIMTMQEIRDYFASGAKEDKLFLKTEEDKVLVYEGAAGSRSLRKQIIVAAPKGQMLRLFTANKETYRQMSKTISNYEESGMEFEGCRLIGDTDTPKKTGNVTVYRFWLMKLAQEKNTQRPPIGIGIGIGGRHHHGPWIGIGW